MGLFHAHRSIAKTKMVENFFCIFNEVNAGTTLSAILIKIHSQALTV